jgi:3-methyl-2-oxobutanoate hydroxymethyltransferase
LISEAVTFYGPALYNDPGQEIDGKPRESSLEVSVARHSSRITIPELVSRKGGEPIAALTAYTAPIARLIDPHVDILLVGDSLGMVVYGLPSTLGVTLDTMIAHGRAVVGASSHAATVVDMPFGSYQASPAQAFAAAARIMAETGCDAVKLEGGAEMADTVAFLTARGVPVMGHVGLTPQSVNILGGYKARGRDPAEAERIIAGAKAIAAAGAFSIVIEGTIDPVSRAVTAAVAVPTIGIGASAGCDGQVLVIDDVLGLSGDFKPKMARVYADLGPVIANAAQSYAADVKSRRFPGPENVYGLSKPGA